MLNGYIILSELTKGYLTKDFASNSYGAPKEENYPGLRPDEVSEFRRLWIEGVMLVFKSAKQQSEWMKIEEVK